MLIRENYTYYLKRYLVVGFPILLNSLSPIFMAVADNAMVGYLGEEVRAAAEFVNIITGTAFLLLIGISSVLMPLVAGALVLRDYEKATNSLKYSVLVNIFCASVCVVILAIIFNFLDYMGMDKGVVALARGGYFQIITSSILINAFYQPLKRYLVGLGFRFLNTFLSFLGAFLNVCLNYILIEGHYGIPALGLNGAGLATLLSRFMIMLIYIFIAWRFRKRGYITASWLGEWDQRAFMKMLKLGLPSGFELSMRMIYLSFINVMIGWIGAMQQSSASILFAFVRLGVMLPLALSIVGSILLSQELKKNHKKGIPILRRTAYGLTLSLMLVCSLLLYKFFPLILDSVFQPEKQVNALVTSLIGMAILVQFMDGLSFIATGFLRGIQDTFVPFLITTFVWLLIGLPLSYYFAFYLNQLLYGIFKGIVIGSFFSAILLYMRFSEKIKEF